MSHHPETLKRMRLNAARKRLEYVTVGDFDTALCEIKTLTQNLEVLTKCESNNYNCESHITGDKCQGCQNKAKLAKL